MIQYIVFGDFKDSKLQLKTFHEGINCRAFEFFGCHRISEDKFVFRVWAPHAADVSVVLNFNNKNEFTVPMNLLSDGESFEAETKAQVGDKYVYKITTIDGRILYKADPYAFRSDLLNSFASVVEEMPLSVDSGTLPQKFDEPVNIYEVNLLSW